MKIPGKAFLRYEFIPKFCYIQVIVFDLSYLPVGTKQVRYHEKILKNIKSNLNVTEVLVSDFKNAFPGIFDFTVGILTRNA